MGLYDGFRTTDSQYIPQYTGLPLDTIAHVGDRLQDTHYQNIAQLSRLQLLGMEQAAETPFGPDKERIQSHIQGISSALQDLAKNGGEYATSRVSALANKFLGDEELIRLRHNANEYRKDEQMARELRTKGATPIRNEKDFQSFQQHGSYDPETGSLREYRSSVQPQLNYVGKQDEIVQPLQPDTYETDLKEAAKTSLVGIMKARGKWKEGMEIPDSDIMAHMPAFLQSDTYKELSSKKVNDYLFGRKDKAGNMISPSHGWNSYKDTAEYKQQKDILGMSDEAIAKELQSRGQAKVFSDTQKQFMPNSVGLQAAGLRGGSTKDIEVLTPSYTSLFNAPQGSLQVDEKTGEIVKLGKEFSFKELFNKAKDTWDGKETDPVTSVFNYLPAGVEAAVKYFKDNKSTLTTAQKDEMKGFEYALSRQNAGKDPSQQVTLPQFISQLSMDNNVPVSLFSKKETIETESLKFFNEKTGGGDYLTRKVYTTDGQTMTAADFYKDDDIGLGIDPADEKQLKDLKEGASIIGVADPKNTSPFARAKVGTRNGKSFLIDDSANASPTEQYIHDTYSYGRLHGSGTVHTVDPTTGKPIKVTGTFLNGSFHVDNVAE